MHSLYNVADIGFIALTNVEKATGKWNKYLQPLNNIIDAINKKEIHGEMLLKAALLLWLAYKAQSRLLGGLGKFCNTIKHKSINFAKDSPLSNPQEYLTTPEGLLFKATAQSSKLKQSGQTATAKNCKSTVENKITKIEPTKQKNLPAINQTSTAILRNGYYEVNSFKLS